MPHRMVGMLLLLLVSVSSMRAQGEVVLSVGGEPVMRSEFEYYFRKSTHRTPDSFLPSFIDYKLKVRYACDAGMDTLPAFRSQMAWYHGKLLRAYRADSGLEEQEARRLYLQGERRLQVSGWIRIAHISKYLSQHAGHREEQEARRLMDSVYTALQEGADFAVLAARCSDDTGCKDQGGLLPWMPVNNNMQEWIDRLASLKKERFSAPFYSPMGIHIVKWVDRKPELTFEEKRGRLIDYLERCGNQQWKELSDGQKDSLEFRVQEVHDGLLAACVSQKYQPGDVSWSEADLEHFFKQHQSDYAWDLPHYRGAVIHCKDKKVASAVKKLLKKKPLSQWEETVLGLAGHTGSPRVRIEAGIFRIGSNAYVDKLVFRCGEFQSDPDFPYTFVMGKKLKNGPDSYEDVRDAVIRNYRMVYEDAWLKELKRKYKVEINQEVLKTVNNNGSN